MEEEFIICKICGEKVKRLYGAHLKAHGMTSQEYKLKYPGEPLTTKSDNKNTTKNSGQHMKTEKYKKMFSEKIMGEKNPNHKSKTTEEIRKERSPFSIEFYKKKYPNLSNKEMDDIIYIFRKDVFDGIINTSQIQYYLNKGYELEESIEKRSERQRTFTLEKCIIKYGEEDGRKIFKNRQDKWQKSLKDNGNLKSGFSKVSQELFREILSYISDDEVYKNIYFSTKNSEYYIEKDDKSIYQYDFVDLSNKKIIEFNGDIYHANPNIFNENDNPNPFRRYLSSKDIWNNDVNKIMLAEHHGFEVMVVWEQNYRKDKDKVLHECLRFLNI